jgi:hypothetical protein
MLCAVNDTAAEKVYFKSKSSWFEIRTWIAMTNQTMENRHNNRAQIGATLKLQRGQNLQKGFGAKIKPGKI